MEHACFALCHFCDNHGPRIITCTQTGMPPNEVAVSPLSPSKLQDSPLDYAISPKSSTSKQSTPTSSLHSSLGSSVDVTCEACRAEGPDDKLGFISSQSNQLFVSRHLPSCKETLVSLRKACSRSYNLEQTGQKEGAVVFGDPSSDYVLSYKFYLKDAHARGFKRLYSIIVLTRTPTYLYQFSACISRQLEVLISTLKEKTDQLFERESLQEDTHALLHMRNRFADPVALSRARSATISQPRSLPTITGDANIFQFIHSSFSSMLKTHLPPNLRSANTSSRLQYLVEKHQLQHILLSKIPSSSPALKLSHDSFSNLRHLSRTIGGHIFDQVLYHLYTGHQIVIRGRSQPMVSSALHHLSYLLPKHCVRMCEYERKYLPLDKCNLLGLHPKTYVPNSFFADTRQSGVILDIFQLEHCSGSDSETDTDSGVGLGDDPLDSYAFQIQPDIPLDYHSQLLLPSVLTHLHNIIYPKIYSEDVMRLAIDSIKQGILTKVLILNKSSRLPSKHSSQLKDKMQNKLLSLIHASEGDLPFLDFWSLPFETTK